MSAERGWIGEPQPPRQWHASHYSRMADQIARHGSYVAAEAHRRSKLQRAVEDTWAEQEIRNAKLRTVNAAAPLQIAARYEKASGVGDGCPADGT